MIQRIQSVYLLLASVLSVVGLCLPVAYIVVGRGDTTLEASVMERVYNLWGSNASESGYSLTTWPLFALLLAAAALTLYTIGFASSSRSCCWDGILCLLFSARCWLIPWPESRSSLLSARSSRLWLCC